MKFVTKCSYGVVFLSVTSVSCVNRRSQQLENAGAKGWFGKDNSPVRPDDFLTVAPKEFDPKDCIAEKLDPGSDLAKIAAEAGENYKIVRSDYAPSCLKYNNPSEGFPPNLQGIWWMNGNPIPEILATFSNSKWDNDKKVAHLKPNDPLSWSWVANKVLGKNFVGGPKTDSTIEVYYDVTDLKNPQDMKSIEKKADGTVKQTPDYLYKYTIIDPNKDPEDANKKFVMRGAKTAFDEQDTDTSDVLVRRTRFLGVINGDYTLTRIVDGNGKILKRNYEVYLKFLADNKHYYSGVQTGTVFP